MAMTMSDLVRRCTESYLQSLSATNPLSPADMERELLNDCRDTAILENATRPKTDKLKVPTKLVPWQIARLMLHVNHVVRVKSAGSASDPDYDILAIYDEAEGIYMTDVVKMGEKIAEYDCTISERERSEVISYMKMYAERVERSTDKDLIAVNNGLFNYETKTLEDFTPDKVFLSKSHVNYNPKAVNVVIHNPKDGTDWDVESWMSDLSDDMQVVDLLWEILGAVLRPHVRWNKSAWFYSESGNNGKGSLCELMRLLCGPDSYTSIPLSDFGKDFALEPLIRAQAIITDENDVGGYIDRAANLKAVVTNDVISINRKFKTPVSYQFYGFMVQCLNGFPKIKDKSDSFYRRQLFIPFTKCFTGMERKYIKNDYLHRPEVLEYVMYRVLSMNYYTLSEPDVCKDVLEDYKDFNDPVRQFVDEMMPQLVWDLVPFGFLYDLYKAWFKKNSPTGSIQGRNTFISDILNLVTPDTGWYCQGRKVAVRPGKKMDLPEPLIIEYNLGDWMSKTYVGSDTNRMARPTLKASYNGFLRGGTPVPDGEDGEDEDE